MPEFELPMGNTSDEQATAFHTYEAVDDFTKGYVEAMFFADCHPDSEELKDLTVHDIAPETWAAIVKDCADFQAEQAVNLEQAFSMDSQYDGTRAGHDFWFTRNGHGVGFWDRSLGEAGDILSDACGWGTKYHGVDVYRGDDGRLYLS